MPQDFISPPPIRGAVDEADERGRPVRVTRVWTSFFMQAYAILFAVAQSGTTSQRPTEGLFIGRPYFDTTLGLPIWWDGSQWGTNDNANVITAVATGANRNVLATENLGTFTNQGATARQDFTLPTAATGLEYTFTIQDTDGIRVIPNSGDTIRIGLNVSGVGALGRIDCTGIGGSVTLRAINATEWMAVSEVTSWAVT